VVTELLRAMRVYEERTGRKMDVVQLHRSHYRELVGELSRDGAFREAVSEGEVREFNGARVEVL